MRKILLIFIFSVTSCRFLPPVGEKYQKPNIKIPTAWNSVKKDEDYVSGSVEQSWWENFNDPVLSQLIGIAVENNRDFKIAKSRVLEARANLTSASSNLGPKVNGSTSASRKNNYVNPVAPNNHTIFNLFTAGFDASWELDLFGANYRSRQASKALFEASTEAKNYILISLIAEVVKNYSELRAAQNQLFLQRQIHAAWEEILELSEAKKLAGLLGEIGLSRVKIALLNSEFGLADSETRAVIALYNLEFLLGKRPGEMRDFFGEIGEVPILQKGMIVDAPLALLHNRPDVKQAERELAAAVELKGYALAQIFPKISLSGFFGFYNTKSGNLLQSSSRVFSSGAQVSIPILDFGGIFAGIKIAEERKKQALLAYEEKLSKALVDVESSMINFIKEDEKLTSNFQSHEIFKMINQLSQKKQNQGLISHLDYLQLRIELLQSEQKLNEVRNEFCKKTVALYKSLGGGWAAFPEKEKAS